jgi:hypothetical protein
MKISKIESIFSEIFKNKSSTTLWSPSFIKEEIFAYIPLLIKRG